MDNRNDTLKKNNKGYRRKPIALIVRYSSPNGHYAVIYNCLRPLGIYHYFFLSHFLAAVLHFLSQVALFLSHFTLQQEAILGSFMAAELTPLVFALQQVAALSHFFALSHCILQSFLPSFLHSFFALSHCVLPSHFFWHTVWALALTEKLKAAITTAAIIDFLISSVSFLVYIIKLRYETGILLPPATVSTAATSCNNPLFTLQM
jgi:hypothetical protein